MWLSSDVHLNVQLLGQFMNSLSTSYSQLLPQLILAPGVGDIVVPGVLHHTLHMVPPLPGSSGDGGGCDGGGCDGDGYDGGGYYGGGYYGGGYDGGGYDGRNSN